MDDTVFSCSMHMLPASHGNGYFKHAAPEGHHIDYHMVDLPNPDDVSWFEIKCLYVDTYIHIMQHAFFCSLAISLDVSLYSHCYHDR